MMRARTVGLFLLLATLLIFLPGTLNQFINFDDQQYVVENSFVNQGLSLAGIKWAFVSAHAANWHPLTWLSHMLDCDLFRLNPAGHHFVNILFHAANATLLFALLLRLTNPRSPANEPDREPQNVWPAALVAALFAWHPLHVESVAWVAERKDVLSTFFSLLTLFCYAQYGRTHVLGAVANSRPAAWLRDRDYLLAVLCFVLALLSKAMPVTLPLVMCLLDWWPLNRWASGSNRIAGARQFLLEKLPFFLLSGIVCLITVKTQQHAESTFATIPLGLRLENVVTAYVDYLGKMIWPIHLAILYPYHAEIARTYVVECILMLAAISLLAWRERRGNPYLLVGWLWFLLTLVPVIGLIQVGSQSMADRYSYFPLIGIFLAAAFTLQAIIGRFPWLKRGVVLASLIALVGCVGLTERQLTFWRDSETLFRHSINVEDSAMARISLGVALQDKNEIDEAMRQFLIAWRLTPDSPLADINLASILSAKGKLELSAEYYELAIRQNTQDIMIFDNYGRELVTLKRYREAEAAFGRAIELDPQAATPRFLRARLFLKEGNDQAALADLDQAMELEPQNLEVMVFTATVLAASDDAKIRDGARAKKLARKAVEATGDLQAAALDVLAMSSSELALFADAQLYEQKAIDVAMASNQQDGLDLLQKHLEAFRNHQPWRESFRTN
jgi:tetratricopeptide (TPR) repeat protein